jgi:hypothetical protein
MKALVLSVLVFIVSIQIIADTPPKVVVKALKQKFPSAVNIIWVKDQDHANLWEASFNLREKLASATFTSDGHWIKSTLEISLTELRDEVKAAVKRDYPGCEIISIKITEWLSIGTWYDVKVRCGNEINWPTYDSYGLPPPRI